MVNLLHSRCFWIIIATGLLASAGWLLFLDTPLFVTVYHPENRAARALYDRIKNGMTTSEVETLIGPPSIEAVTSGIVWHSYPQTHARITVWFDESNRVIDKEWNELEVPRQTNRLWRVVKWLGL
jgi:hypothetical protein